MKKLNVRALIALIIYLGVIGLMIHDFILLVCGAQYTNWGMATGIAAVLIGCECENYLRERLER